VLAALCQGPIAGTARAAKNRSQTCSSSCKKQDGECCQFTPLPVRPWHIASASVRYAKGLCAICQSQGSRPSLSKIHCIWRTCFYIDGCATVRTVALKWPILKQRKGCATVRLGLNYCYMGSSQPPSRDTVPLT
jgi:hypothetical protein